MKKLTELRLPASGWIASQIGRSNWQSTKCLFILGTGRIGSTTTIQMLNCSPKIAAFHEPRPSRLMAAKSAYADLRENEHEYRRMFTKIRRGPIGAIGRSDRIYAEWGSWCTLGPMIANLLPRASFLHLYRHPGGVIRSGIRRGYYVNNSWDKYRIEPPLNDPIREDWDQKWDPFRKIAWMWQAVNGGIIAFKSSIAPKRFMSISSEDMWDINSGVQTRLFEFLGVKPPQKDQIRETLSAKYNAQEGGEFPVYHRWTDKQRQVLREIAGPVMEALGYD